MNYIKQYKSKEMKEKIVQVQVFKSHDAINQLSLVCCYDEAVLQHRLRSQSIKHPGMGTD